MKKIPFIVLDGGEGAGKTTLLQRLKNHFGNRLVATREPGGSPKAEEIRTYIFAHPELTAREQFNKFWEARQSHLEETIRPALNAGIMVVCDRFDSSTFAYQIVEKLHPELIEDFWKYRREIIGETQPDLYVYLDVAVEVGLARKATQSDVQLNHFDAADINDQKRRQEGFRDFFKHVPHQVIDANRSADEVYADLVTILESRMN